MDNNRVTNLLLNFRCFEYAAKNCGPETDNAPLVLSERKSNPDGWDRTRYNRIVNMVRGAVEHVLSDDQRTVINRLYLERNTLNISQVSAVMHISRTTVYTLHREALRKLCIALEPLNESDMEIQEFNHMFDHNWRFKEPAI